MSAMTETIGATRRGNNTSILGVGALTSVFLFLALLMATYSKDAGMEYQALTFLLLGGVFRDRHGALGGRSG